MRITEVEEISLEKDLKQRLEDKRKNISLAVALAGGLVWREKVESFHEVIAKELLEIFNDNLLDNLELNEFNKDYKRTYIKDKTIMYNRNNLFRNTYKKLDISKWLDQVLLYIDNKAIPDYLTVSEKEKIESIVDEDEIYIINQYYSNQELNKNRYLKDNTVEHKKVLNILDKAGYFNLTIYEYIKIIATGKYGYKYKYIVNKFFKITYNNYILEIGSYIAKEIESYIK